jgi:hypothetical protein
VTEPQPVMAQAEQDQLTRRVGRSLLTVAGEGWQRVRAEYRSAGRHIEVDVFVTGPDGVEHPVRPPQEVVEGLGRLRQGMYRPGRGTWLSGVYLLEPPSSFSAEFEPDAEPRWRRVPPPIGFADELKFFPRADENIPDWLRQRAGLPPLPTAEQGGQPQPTPPSGTAGPFSGHPQQGGQPGSSESTPPRGVPTGPFGGQQPAGQSHGGQPTGEPTPPPGIPARPFTGQPQASGQPGNGQQHGIPAGPYSGQQPGTEPETAGGESWFGGQIAEAEGKPAPRGFGVPATPFPPDEPRR